MSGQGSLVTARLFLVKYTRTVISSFFLSNTLFQEEVLLPPKYSYCSYTDLVSQKKTKKILGKLVFSNNLRAVPTEIFRHVVPEKV